LQQFAFTAAAFLPAVASRIAATKSAGRTLAPPARIRFDDITSPSPPNRIEAALGHDENEGNTIERQDIGSVRRPIAACLALP